MWELEGCFMSNNRSSEVSTVFERFASDMHILLVDHDKELLISTSRMLELCSYKVTMVELASTAMLMLLKGNETFDLVMVNVQPNDKYGFKLLKEVDRLCMPLILLSSHHSNHDMAKTAIATGAILFLQRPASLEVLKYIWQLVLIDKRRRNTQLTLKDEERCQRRIALEEADIICNGDGGVQIQNKSTNNSKLKKKECTQWTKELHAKFLDAVNKLGVGKCYPKEILQLMNVPGLTRMQVASHLQKCRNFNWKTRKEHKIATDNRRSNSPEIIDPHQSKSNMMSNFGNMPQFYTDKNQEPLETQMQNDYHPQIHPEAPDQWHNGNNIILGRNIQGNGEDNLGHQFGMPNISTSENHYLPPQHHQFLGTYDSFSSEVDYGMQNYNFQSQIPITSQCLNLNDDLDF